MAWGLEKADELGLDIFLDSTPHGRPLYEANGFSYVHENAIHLEGDDEVSEKLARRVGDFTFWLMQRRPDCR